METGWMIEGKDYKDVPMWWRGATIKGSNYNNFSSDSLDGIRFARKEDAEKAMYALFSGAEVTATEHEWIATTALAALPKEDKP